MKKTRRGWGKPRETALRTMDIVRWLQKSDLEVFTVNEIAAQYDIKRGEAYRRVKYMILYQLVRPMEKLEREGQVGRRQITYALTPWGHRYEPAAVAARVSG